MAVASTARPAVKRAQSRKDVAAAPNAKPVALAVAATMALAAVALVPSVNADPRLRSSILGAAVVLAAGVGVVLWNAKARRRALATEVSIRRPHYLQAVLQGSIYAYWGYYYRPVYDQVPLIAAQLAFAYAFDMLLTWSRRDKYMLGFGPFPIIFSINLFIWFKPEWYYLQFALVALGFLAKEFLRWQKDGQSAHIFNPSSFPLALFSVVLIATSTTSMTYGVEIATTQFNPPNIYLMLFLIGLPGQFFFGVTPMVMTAVVSTYLFGAVYFAATGTYFFVDSYIPVSVFLGMHLLFTDPATAPRTELGRIIYGVLYAIGNIVLYDVLQRAGIPTFYDKLLPVPLMNVSVQAIDRLARMPALRAINPANLAPAIAARKRNLAYITVWAVAFAGMSSVHAVGDHHPGHRVPFWQHACDANLRNGCSTLGQITQKYCADGSGWACNELGVLQAERRVTFPERAAESFQNACGLGFTAGCQNRAALGTDAKSLRRAPPRLPDYPVILRSGKGALPDTTPFALYDRACDQGFMSGCQGLASLYRSGEGTARDPQKALALLERTCADGDGTGCSDLGLMHFTGDGVPLDKRKGLAYLKQACDKGYAQACDWYAQQPPG